MLSLNFFYINKDAAKNASVTAQYKKKIIGFLRFAAGIIKWGLAIHLYHVKSKIIKPKRI